MYDFPVCDFEDSRYRYKLLLFGIGEEVPVHERAGSLSSHGQDNGLIVHTYMLYSYAGPGNVRWSKYTF